MSDPVILMLLAVGAVVVALVVLAVVRKGPPVPADYSDETKILAEVAIYEAYGRTSQAIELLEKAVKSAPERERYKQKLHELKRST